MSLASALDDLYAALASARPVLIEGCPCCIGRKKTGTLQAKPLRALTADDLGPYAASVFLTVGHPADFRYFLPRMLEICATEPGWWPSPEIVIGKLRLAGWATWRAADRRAVEAVLRAMFETEATGPSPDGDRLKELLCGFARADLPLGPFLQRLTAPDAEAALRSFVVATWNGHHGALMAPKTGFWAEAPGAAAPLQAFLDGYQDRAMAWLLEAYERDG